jgi:hypothetical protein
VQGPCGIGPVLTRRRVRKSEYQHGAFDISAASATLVVLVDQVLTWHRPIWRNDKVWKITVNVIGNFVSTAATTAEIVTWPNGNAAFAPGKYVYNQAGKVGIRSRNLQCLRHPVAGQRRDHRGVRWR